MTSPSVTAVVLAGGRATRFGADKLAVEVDGRPLLQRAITAVAEVADEIVVVVGATARDPVLPAGLPVPVIVAHDSVAGRGPLAGLAAGLAAASHPFAVLVGGDQPALQPPLLRELVRRLVADAGLGVAPVDVFGLEQDGRLRPLPTALRVAAVRPAAEAALAGGTRSLVGLFGRLPVAALAPDEWRVLDPAGDSLRDIDTRDDLLPHPDGGAHPQQSTTPPEGGSS